MRTRLHGSTAPTFQTAAPERPHEKGRAGENSTWRVMEGQENSAALLISKPGGLA